MNPCSHNKWQFISYLLNIAWGRVFQAFHFCFCLFFCHSSIFFLVPWYSFSVRCITLQSKYNVCKTDSSSSKVTILIWSSVTHQEVYWTKYISLLPCILMSKASSSFNESIGHSISRVGKKQWQNSKTQWQNTNLQNEELLYFISDDWKR